jgi:putative flippase GtrA
VLGFIITKLFRSSKHQQQARQFAKYMAGGSLYFWVGYAIFAICYSGLHWGWLPSKILADAVGWSLNYIVQRFWAFADRAHLSEMKHARRYITIEAIGFALDYLIIGGLRAIGITPYIGFFISSAFFTVWSYLWYKYWVFPEHGGKIKA